MRLAGMPADASSGILPPSRMCSSASQAALSPDVSAVFAGTRKARLLPALSGWSMASARPSGISAPMAGSPKARGRAIGAGASETGFLTRSPSLRLRPGVATCLPRPARASAVLARTPTTSPRSCQTGPARQRLPSTRTYPRLSGFALAPSRGIEDNSRKSEHARQVLDESLLGSNACPVPCLDAYLVTALSESFVELIQGSYLRDGYQQVAPEKAHGVLDRAPLVPRVGVAVAALAAAVRPGPGEGPRLHGPAEGHPAGLGGVAGHERARRAPRPLEDVAQTPAEGLGLLWGQSHTEAGVGMWEAHHQRPQGKALASHLRLEAAEVDLSCAWGPPRLEEALPGPLHVLALPCRRMPPGRGAGACMALLGNCPVEGPLGRMPLPSRHRLVTCECRIDPAGQAIRRRVGASLRDGRLGRHVLSVCVP